MLTLSRPVSLLAIVLTVGPTAWAAGGDGGLTANTPSGAAKAGDAKSAPTKAKVAPKPTASSAKPAKPTAPGATGTSAAGTPPASPATAVDGKDVPVGTPPAGASPLAALKKSNDELDKLLKKKYPQWSPEAEAQKAAVRKLVGGFLDYRELAHRALARHWESLKPAQRQEFVSTLRDLVERSYLKQVTGDPNYNIKYLKEEKNGGEATVDATLTTVTRGKKVAVALVYKVVYKDRWLVYDVVTDEQSMLENYRAEFNKIINKEGFDALLKRMKKKLQEDQTADKEE